MSSGCSCVQLGFMDLDRNRGASVGLIQTSEASVRKPPPATGIAAKEGCVRYRLRLHVISASRTQCLCSDRDASGVTNSPVQRDVILHEKIHLPHIEPEPVSGGTDIKPRTMACWNLNKVLLTVEAFHGEHRVQTVAKIGQVSTRKARNRVKRRRFPQGHQRAIMWQDELAGCGKTIVARGNFDVSHVWNRRSIPRRMLKKARLLTRPTLAVTSPARPESAMTASSPRDAPCPRQGLSSVADARFTFHGCWERRWRTFSASC